MSDVDLNLTVLSGRLTAQPEIETLASGTRRLRALVTVRTERPRRRIDVIPVVVHNPSHELVDELVNTEVRGLPVWVAGSVQRQFWGKEANHPSRLIIVAHDININRTREERR